MEVYLRSFGVRHVDRMRFNVVLIRVSAVVINWAHRLQVDGEVLC